MRVGFAGKPNPDHSIPTMYSLRRVEFREDEEKPRNELQLDDIEFEYRATGKRSFKDIFPIGGRYPLVYGEVKPLFEYIFLSKLNLDPSTCRLLLLLDSSKRKKDLNMLQKSLVEDLGLNEVKIYFHPLAVTKAYRKDTALVIDMGSDHVDVETVINGKLEFSERINVGRYDIHNYFQLLMREKGFRLNRATMTTQIYEFMDAVGSVYQLSSTTTKPNEVPESTVTFLDGTTISFSHEVS